LDAAKSVLAVLLARLFSDAPGVEVAAAVAAIAGHNWPVFVGFKGGRGTATGVGGLLILSPVSGLIALGVGLPTIALWRYVSLGSLLGGASGVITLTSLSLVGAEPMAYIWYGAIGLTMVVTRHKDNIERLVRRQEHKLGRPAERVKA
jgi:glycerol-3-phosphate acyltransferase PlsY